MKDYESQCDVSNKKSPCFSFEEKDQKKGSTIFSINCDTLNKIYEFIRSYINKTITIDDKNTEVYIFVKKIRSKMNKNLELFIKRVRKSNSELIGAYFKNHEEEN